MQKSELRRIAASIDLRTAGKPDSQDVCFITSTGGRTAFLGERIPFRHAAVVDSAGDRVGEVDAVEMVTIGQRKGLGLPGGGPKRFAVDVDVDRAVVTVGSEADLLRADLDVDRATWTNGAVEGAVVVQCSAHGATRSATLETAAGGDRSSVRVTWDEPQRRVAPGQSVVFYDLTDTRVLGGGIAR
jgi:tRNA-specific 2-thiouridylase